MGNCEELDEKLENNNLSESERKVLELKRDKTEKKYILAFAMSIFWIAVLAYAMVEWAAKMGCILGIRGVFMGLTVLAAGTSIPDALGSVEVASNGKGDMAVANAIGSNVFDILIGLGFPWFLYGLVYGEPFLVKIDDLDIFIFILYGTLIFTILSFFLTKWYLGKLIGGILLSAYAAFFVFAGVYAFVISK